MKKTKIIYYIFTSLFCVTILMGAYFELTGDKTAQDGMIHLGFPVYFNTILGVAKILGVIALFQNFFPTLKEWGYAGFAFDLIGAFVCILAVGDPISGTMPALISLVLMLVSYVAFRKLKAVGSQKVTTIRA